MAKGRNFLETFDLAIGRLIALMLGGAGALALLIAFEARDSGDVVLPIGIGVVLLLVAAAMLYWRITFLSIFEFLAGGFSR
ncbi:MAG: hypothetical protein AAFO77_03825 [Pseudomonadota bacterium]